MTRLEEFLDFIKSNVGNWHMTNEDYLIVLGMWANSKNELGNLYEIKRKYEEAKKDGR